MTVKKTVSVIIKIFLITTSLGGVFLSLLTAQKDGFSHWARRLLYFTAQSNLWIGFSALFALFLGFAPYCKSNAKLLFVTRYVCVVSITMTGVVFCGLLAPFAKDYGFQTWTVSSLLTHVVSPTLAIVDFFLDRQTFIIKKSHALLCVIPSLIYFSLSFVLEYFRVDFGRGVPYPYFFMNFRSPIGFFGFSATPPFVLGTFYWFLLFPSLLYAIAFLYRYAYNRRKR
ncbi:MAG: hypothetical protein E7355_05000 [Clostridiales bacterium]|nr:hypothetical protein [Clostridiales bacterium]